MKTITERIKNGLGQMETEQWYTIDEIFKYMVDNVELTSADWAIADGYYECTWKRITRSTLGNIKRQGYLKHEYAVSKGEGTNISKQARYMFTNEKQKVIEIEVDHGKKYFNALLEMEREQWFTLEEIYEYIESLGIIEEEERVRSKVDNPMPIWKHRIYTALGHMKNRGYAEHQKCIAKVNSPTGKKIPAMYKFYI